MKTRFEVVVVWDNELFSHKAKSLKEAVEWESKYARIKRRYPTRVSVRVWVL